MPKSKAWHNDGKLLTKATTKWTHIFQLVKLFRVMGY